MPKAQRHGSCQCENSNTCPIPGWQPSQAHSSLTPAAGPVCLTRRMLGAASIPTYQALGMRARRRATRPKERAPRRVRRHLAEPCASAGCGKGSPATNRKKKRGCDRGVDRAEEGKEQQITACSEASPACAASTASKFALWVVCAVSYGALNPGERNVFR